MGFDLGSIQGCHLSERAMLLLAMMLVLGNAQWEVMDCDEDWEEEFCAYTPREDADEGEPTVRLYWGSSNSACEGGWLLENFYEESGNDCYFEIAYAVTILEYYHENLNYYKGDASKVLWNHPQLYRM